MSGTITHRSMLPTPIHAQEMERLKECATIVSANAVKRPITGDGCMVFGFVKGMQRTVSNEPLANLYDAAAVSLHTHQQINSIWARVVVDPDLHLSTARANRHMPFYNWHTDMAIAIKDEQVIMRRAMLGRTCIVFGDEGAEYLDDTLIFEEGDYEQFSWPASDMSPDDVEYDGLEGHDLTIIGADRQFVRGPVYDPDFAHGLTIATAEEGVWNNVWPNAAHHPPDHPKLGRVCLVAQAVATYPTPPAG